MAKTSKQQVNFLPTAGYILIEPQEVQTKTSGGIYLAENANPEKPQKGKVLAIGSEEILDNGDKRMSPAKIDDIVIYKKWGGNEVKENGKDYIIVKFEDILAIVK